MGMRDVGGGSAPLRDVKWEQLSYEMCACAQATNTACQLRSNKAVPSFSGCLPRALDMVVTPPTQARSLTCLSHAMPN